VKPITMCGQIGTDAQSDIDHTLALMREMQAVQDPSPILRVYAPRPTVAFSRRESLMPSFAAAQEAARDHGFAPVIRLAGGRAVAYDESCLVIDLVTPSDRHMTNELVFDVVSESMRRVLVELGVDARVGAVRREYCAGPHSVNARGEVKLVGIAQRVTRGARLVTASVALGPAMRLRSVVDAVYAAMSLDWDPETFGTLAGEGVQASPEEFAQDVITGLALTHTEWAEPFV
jgi:octanoyl-[GcvH]:protein N-octanoyltransferase